MSEPSQIPTNPVVSTAFDPSKYLTKVGGADYLEVKWRLVWLRQRHPDAEIVTSLEFQGEDWAVFRARVSIPGGGSATGWGSEVMRDFRDYIEKAETKAIGRALAALGFGTQFCPDFDYSDGFPAGKFPAVDSPVDFTSQRGRRVGAAGIADHHRVPAPVQPVGGQVVTPRQIKFIHAIAREAGLDDVAVAREVEEAFGCSLAELGRREASEYIERLQARRGTQLNS